MPNLSADSGNNVTWILTFEPSTDGHRHPAVMEIQFYSDSDALDAAVDKLPVGTPYRIILRTDTVVEMKIR